MSPRSKRLEWISLLYLLFFVLAVISPSIYTHSYFGLSETRLEELTIFFFGLAGLVTFTAYERLVEGRDRERVEVQNAYEKAKGELIESYAYIGSVNRKIELLKKLADDQTVSIVDIGRMRKEVFQALAANACAAVDAEAALIRFVDLDRLRTEREFSHQSEPIVFRVANKDLRAVHEQHLSHSLVRSEEGGDVLVIPSDRQGASKGYLLLRIDPQKVPDVDTSLLKVFVNQAEMLYQHFQPALVETT